MPFPARARKGAPALDRLARARVLTASGALVAASASLDVPPRSLAPYLERRLFNHGRWARAAGGWLAGVLMDLDRGPQSIRDPSAIRVGARSDPASRDAASGRMIFVAGPERRAVGAARPGDVITLEPGPTLDPWAAAAPRIPKPGSSEAPDLCRTVRAPRRVYCAFEDFWGCTGRPTGP